jgi:hypothetical protein
MINNEIKNKLRMNERLIWASHPETWPYARDVFYITLIFPILLAFPIIILLILKIKFGVMDILYSIIATLLISLIVIIPTAYSYKNAKSIRYLITSERIIVSTDHETVFQEQVELKNIQKITLVLFTPSLTSMGHIFADLPSIVHEGKGGWHQVHVIFKYLSNPLEVQKILCDAIANTRMNQIVSNTIN